MIGQRTAWLVVATCACGGHPVSGPPTGSAPSLEHSVSFAGTITDLDFGCWADLDCGIKVNDTWIKIEGGMQDQPRPAQGQVTGIAMSGAPADELKAKNLGREVEVFAAEQAVYEATGQIRFDAKHLTLTGSAEYYVRAR